ncbi:hypothetical protein CJ030_MR6G013284 [Morella rubra]|uniref:Uncharacterized protein n=1 Tax=Morella rubra TaxID=262757 RepID=A0A6A1VF93_9ROSI|nr:hypothetical protein CJ030_MR6G013284 [Morella rubra]
MEVHKRKGGVFFYHLAFFVMLILLDSYCCGAAVLVKSNSSFRCDGRLDECLIEEDLELEFLMNPYVSRILANHKEKPNNLDPYKAIFKKPCGETNDPQYQKCIDAFKVKHHGCKCDGIYCRCKT